MATVKAAYAAAEAKEEAEESYDKYRSKEDMRTILEAARIQKDPARMKNVRRCAKEELSELKAMQALAGGK